MGAATVWEIYRQAIILAFAVKGVFTSGPVKKLIQSVKRGKA